jgi:hypothetical protein
MKKLISITFAIAQLCIVSSPLIAQNAIAHININEIKDNHSSVLNAKADKNFRKEFRNVSNATWMEKEDGYRVKFTDNDIRFMVDYDKKGNWLSTISNYSEDDLDPGIAVAVKTAFLGYAIVHVTEVRKGDVIAYLVKIDNQKLLKTVRVINGEMDVYEAYVKS